jgi:hypothetical protein
MILGTSDLFELLDCSDVQTVLHKLASIGVRPHIPSGSPNHVLVSTYELPTELRERASEIATAGLVWDRFPRWSGRKGAGRALRFPG